MNPFAKKRRSQLDIAIVFDRWKTHRISIIHSQTVEFALDACFPATLGLDLIHQFLGLGKEVVHLPGQLFALFGIRDALQLLLQRLRFPASLARPLSHLVYTINHDTNNQENPPANPIIIANMMNIQKKQPTDDLQPSPTRSRITPSPLPAQPNRLKIRMTRSIRIIKPMTPKMSIRNYLLSK